MAQVTVQIGGRDYKMACGEGEEEHLLNLAREVDARHAQLKDQFGEVGDNRLSIMTAIMMADELSEAKRRQTGLKAELESLKIADKDAVKAFDKRHAEVAEHISMAAERLEMLAEELADGVRRE